MSYMLHVVWLELVYGFRCFRWAKGSFNELIIGRFVIITVCLKDILQVSYGLVGKFAGRCFIITTTKNLLSPNRSPHSICEPCLGVISVNRVISPISDC